MDVNVVGGSNGDTPLHYARTETIARLLLEAGGHLNALNNASESPLDVAKEMSRLGVVRLFTSRNRD